MYLLNYNVFAFFILSIQVLQPLKVQCISGMLKISFIHSSRFWIANRSNYIKTWLTKYSHSLVYCKHFLFLIVKYFNVRASVADKWFKKWYLLIREINKNKILTLPDLWIVKSAVNSCHHLKSRSEPLQMVHSFITTWPGLSYRGQVSAINETFIYNLYGF